MPTLKGTWEPPRLTRAGAYVITWGLVAHAFTRGLDYLIRWRAPGASTGTLAAIEEALPVQVWVALYMLGAVSLTFGLALRAWRAATLAYSVLAVAYSATGLGVLVEAATTDKALSSAFTSGSFLLLGVIHSAYWVRSVIQRAREDEVAA